MSMEKPTIVMIHDKNQGSLDTLTRGMEIGAPYSLVSYTDTYPDWNDHNEGMFEEILGAVDILMVQEGLTQPPTLVAKLALCAAISSGARVGIFDEDYVVRMVDHVTAQRMSTGQMV